MGFLKELHIEGISYIDKYVCDECFEDYAIKEYIQKNAISETCDYCGKPSAEDKPVATPLHEVVRFILEGIRYEWDEPVNEVGWCSQEGGWIGATITDTYDLISDELDLGIRHDELRDDIIQSINIYEWCQRNPYGLPPEEEMLSEWERFSRQVKYHTRYVFYRVTTQDKDHDFDSREPHDIMNALGKIVNELGLIRHLPAETEFIRARGDKKRLPPTINELGPPSRDNAIYSNRMSPAGIPMFYGSFEETTAIAEIKDKATQYVTTAAFKTARPFKVLDLTRLPGFPSLFDESRRHLRAPLIFLRDFLKDFSKPIEKDGREHIKYVPTQVVTEYFRHIFRNEEAEQVKGIIYPSARRKTGRSCVLFFEEKDCMQDTDIKVTPQDKWLILVTGSVKTVRTHK